MGKLKEAFFEVLENINENPEGCTCPMGVNSMDKLCPCCIAEYEEKLCADYEALQDAGLILIEDQNEREIFEASLKKA